MVDLIPTPTLLAAAAIQAEKTERSPLLYAWLTLQVVFLVAVGYGVFRLVQMWRAKRHPRG
ncbi:hypothetical protein ACFYNO_35790 [Kitasatospora sp. NPDC006697]|uniref:hypothetical protein n=1 Tax=Kitasatospora sp. NPDC006697 TaxID=3364020 RepID=UPI003692D209